MQYRHSDGTLSDFGRTPGQVDQFRLKTPFNDDVTDSNSLEIANDFNHMFDACLRLENSNNGLRVGGPIYGLAPGIVGATRRGVRLSAATHTLVQVGVTYTASGVIPVEYGADPFLDPNFSVMHTIYNEPSGSDIVEGLWSNAASNYDALTASASVPRFKIAVYPSSSDGSGRNYSIKVVAEETPYGYADDGYRTGENYSHTLEGVGVVRPLGAAWGGDYKVMGNTAATFSCTEGESDTLVAHSIVMSTEHRNNGYGGLAYPVSVLSGTDQSIEFTYVGFRSRNIEPGGGEKITSCGFILRGNGLSTAASGYCLLIGDTSVVPPEMHIVRIADANLLTDLDGFTTFRSTPECTELATGGGILGSDTRYRFSIIGSDIYLHSKTGMYGTWTLVMSANDSAYTSGRAGMFSQARDDAMNRYLRVSQVAIRNLTAAPSRIVKAQLVFARVGTSALPMETI